MRQIFTLDARDNMLLEVMQDRLNLDSTAMRREIEAMHSELERILVKKGVPYHKLKSALVPQPDRHEAGFIFDCREVGSGWYGRAIAGLVLPLLDKRVPQSVLHGDLLGQDQNFIFEVLEHFMVLARSFTFEHASLLYCVYINNLTDAGLKALHDGLARSPGYLGYIPATFHSVAKSYLSTTVATAFVKAEGRVLMPHEDDRPNDEDVNILGFPFQESGYRIASFQALYFGPFLSYKVEGSSAAFFPRDIEMSLNAVHDRILPLQTLRVRIDDEKFSYLQTQKLNRLRLAGADVLTREELQDLIAEKVAANYIYNLTFLDEHNVVKFNVQVEVPRSDGGYPARFVAALEYIPENEELRLITLT